MALGLARRILLQPELTAVMSCILVFSFFSITAGSNGFLSQTGFRNVLDVAAEVGIIAAPVTLLLVAGEFDLSVGSMIGAGQCLVAYSVAGLKLPLGLALLIGVAVACCVGLVNGLFVVRTRVPSFIVTLAALFVVRGITQGGIRLLTGETTVSGVVDQLRGDPLLPLFNATIGGLSVSLIWWLAITILAAWVLERTRFGNWTFATGGSLDAAKRAGVATDRVKIVLFMCSAVSAVVVGALGVMVVNQGNVNAGTGREFEVAVSAVMGGALISGGYGSPIGAAFGALLFGMVDQGFFFTNIPDEWFQTFLGVMLMVAVLVNQRTRAIMLDSLRRLAA